MAIVSDLDSVVEMGYCSFSRDACTSGEQSWLNSYVNCGWRAILLNLLSVEFSEILCSNLHGAGPVLYLVRHLYIVENIGNTSLFNGISNFTLPETSFSHMA
ncbi:hypothetical protein Ancab_028565 [Ancistrocladus abbreviatus]